ncbi:LacI family DNA-binding transcriptional regulator [Lactiplantibacillus fabifermentans]|uniref:LacI family sugar-binding transcriptional regulator n=2 Tax=Lactiplantibacillus fabifermentans TaxID=483011 RepID=A0A0R2NRL1_9LACO|nr:LacI family DNA-binding transcriptional regulator [Lactiplantibacillus fabifermentans]ETY73242.1 LacI family transcription regulator [Lactiplantibacillus fabifermentans T30PCM01]KRO28324.1 LacI family sugar-binding transcriptional regulator [Lactiplantibacillus fabifermentans DSM 21115]
MATIFDIAALADTSKSTVSRVISGHGYVSSDTRKRVLAAMKTLDYVPNQLARQLKAQRTQTIGFLMHEYAPVVGDFVNYFTQAAQAKQYRVNIYQTATATDELAVLNRLMTHEIDAVFILTRCNPWDKIIPYTRFGPIATWQRIDSDKIYSSYLDHYPLYRQILDYLATQGVTKIGHVFNDPKAVNTQARLQALVEFQQAAPQIDNSWQYFYQFQAQAGQQAAETWLTTPQPPSAVVIYADFVAAEFIATLRAHGKRVPEDCRVFGFDNSVFSQLMAISTVDAQLPKQAHNAFTSLYNTINQTTEPYQELTPKLIFRETC